MKQNKNALDLKELKIFDKLAKKFKTSISYIAEQEIRTVLKLEN